MIIPATQPASPGRSDAARRSSPTGRRPRVPVPIPVEPEPVPMIPASVASLPPALRDLLEALPPEARLPPESLALPVSPRERTMNTLHLIKVGGSLLDWSELPPRLRAFLDEELGRRDGSRVALIVGGGGAADFMRAMDRIHGLGDDAAHRLAIRAMDLTAHVLRTLLPGSSIVRGRDALQAAWDRGEVPILSPRGFLEELDDGRPDALPASWDVTSDSIAARIAERLGASRLVLLKSVDLPEGTNRAEASRLGLVDAMFPLVARSLDRLEWVSLKAQPIVPRILGS